METTATAIPQMHRQEDRTLKRAEETLALELGVSQQMISKIEASETIEEAILEKVARLFGMQPEAVKTFDEDAVFTVVANTFNNNSSDNSTIIASAVNYLPSFNPINKVVALYDEKVALLEQEQQTRISLRAYLPVFMWAASTGLDSGEPFWRR